MPHLSKDLVASYFLAVLLCCICWVLPLPLWAAIPVSGMDPANYPAPDVGCLATDKCHAGIEPIRAHNS
jgi:hypothetical protein